MPFMIIYLSLLLLLSNAAQAQTIEGSCVQYPFPLDSSGMISTNIPVRVLRANTALYPSSESDQGKIQLQFNDMLIPMKVAQLSHRIQVREIGASVPLGWVNENDLLCSYKPLLGKNGLERKVFIKTPRTTEVSHNSVTAYPSPEGNECKTACNQLSRFELYFIFAQDDENKRYLVSDVYNLATPDLPKLIGWVDDDNSIIWSTTIGIRPIEQISGYFDLEESAKSDKKSGVELEGGPVWYTLPIHIPLLDREQNHYKVAAAGVGMEGFKPLDTSVLTPLKQVDVFFLIDGTATMSPYIQAAKQVVLDIADHLRDQPAYRETTFRFGFRIYRDLYADSLQRDGKPLCRQGICEGLPLSATTCQLQRETTDESWKLFVEKISQVEETKNDKDDYPEKLFDGLRQAVQDMASCEQHTKLLFVIGDHGDRQDNVPTHLTNLLKNNFQRFIVAFIQTPQDQITTSLAYQDAYAKFKAQGLHLIEQAMTVPEGKVPIKPDDYFVSLQEAALLPQRVLNLVAQYSPSDIVNEIQQALRGGDALQNILQKLMKTGDMPVLYWQWVEEAACAKLGEQCQTSVDHQVNEFYVPIDKNKIQEEVWMEQDGLDKWLALLRPFDEVRVLPVNEQRSKFADLILEQVQNILGGPPLREDRTLQEQFEKLIMGHKSSLPLREDSPLLQYTLQEIREEISADCELPRLIEWVTAIRQVLLKVSAQPTLEVSFKLEDYPPTMCPLTAKGQRLQKLIAEQKRKLGPNDEYRYDHNFRGQTIYWLPLEFLP